MKDTAQELTCSICSNKYAQNRPKVRLCSNFHYICFPCLQNIAKINPMNPKCPSCKAQLDIKQIEREQKVYKSIYPLPHYSQKLKYEQSICSQCEREGLITMLCETCNFRVCSDCHFKFHMKSCKETEREYFANLQFAGKCGKCGKKRKESREQVQYVQSYILFAMHDLIESSPSGVGFKSKRKMMKQNQPFPIFIWNSFKLFTLWDWLVIMEKAERGEKREGRIKGQQKPSKNDVNRPVKEVEKCQKIKEKQQLQKEQKKCIFCSKSSTNQLPLVERPQTITICTNSHHACLKCIRLLTSPHPQCPECHQIILFSSLESCNVFRRSFCPYEHYSRTLFVKDNYCNNCGSKTQVKFKCEDCKFNICSRCIVRWHHKFCKVEITFLPKGGSKKGKQKTCMSCNEKFVLGIHCDYCQMNACSKCTQMKKLAV